MEIITLKINQRTKFGKALMALLEIGIQEKKVEVVTMPNLETLKAIEDVKKGKTTKVKNSKELFKDFEI